MKKFLAVYAGQENMSWCGKKKVSEPCDVRIVDYDIQHQGLIKKGENCSICGNIIVRAITFLEC
jgi:hypothetical protein